MKHEIFESNPQLKEVHVTADGECFYNDSDAKVHAKSLKDKKVELVLNPDHLEVVDEELEEVTTDALGTEEAPKVETPKVEAPKVETPKVEAPEVETPKVETPKVEAPEVETPEVETPKVEAPVAKNKKSNPKEVK